MARKSEHTDHGEKGVQGGGNGQFKSPKTEAVNTSSNLKGFLKTHLIQTPRCVIKETEVQKCFGLLVKSLEWFNEPIVTAEN